MASNLCLTTGCARVGKIRGLCNSHYAACVKYITQGKTSWAKLERQGKVLPQNPGGRPAGKTHRIYGEVRDYFTTNVPVEQHKLIAVPVLD